VAREAKIGLLLGLMFIVGIAVVLRGLHQTDEPRWEDQLAINGDVTTSTETAAESMDFSEGVEHLTDRPADLGPSWARQEVEPEPVAAPPVAATLPPMQTTTVSEQVPAVAVAPPATETPAPGAMGDAAMPGFVAAADGPSDLPAQMEPWQQADSDEPVDVAAASQRNQEHIRYSSNLPGSDAAEESVAAPAETTSLEEALDNLAKANKETRVAVVGEAPAVSVPASTGPMKTHVVAEGENLWKIAVKAYGQKEGKRWANMQRIYEANKDILSAPEKVFVGQKLKVPALPGPSVSGSAVPKTAPAKPSAADKSTKKARKARPYVVKKGDTLWSIAAEQLGAGTRYKEIHRLNAMTLKNANSVVEGMKILLPGE